jgi:glyoxylase-like metal-dependent hydrolase (beta-lactamase superfamily II)
MSFARRKVLQAAFLGGVAGMLGIPALRALRSQAQSSGGEVSTQSLGQDLHVLTAAGSNVLALTGVDGVAMVDGGSASTSARLLQAVAALPGGGPVHTLFNTHWHPEQTGSNEAVRKAAGTVIAQDNTKLWLSTDVTWPWNGQTVHALAKDARPNKSFYTDGEMTVHGRRIQYGHIRDCPHTDGDLYVLFPDANVLAVGGAVCSSAWQMCDWWTGGWIGGIVGGLEHLLTLANAETRIVPAEGAVLSYADLQAQLMMYSTVWERLAELLYTGRGPLEAVAAHPTKEFDEHMGNPDEFVDRAFRSLWAYLTPDA